MLTKIKCAHTNHKHTNGRTHCTYSPVLVQDPNVRPYRNWQSPVPKMGPCTDSPVLVRGPKNNHTGTGRAHYRKWDHEHKVQFWYGTLKSTVPVLAEPVTQNWTTSIELDHKHRIQFRYGTLKTTVPELAEPGTRNGKCA